MNVVCEIVLTARAGVGRIGVAAAAVRSWAMLPGLLRLDLYAPAATASHDPYVQDGPSPAHLAILAFSSLEALDGATRHATFAAGLSAPDSCAVSCTAMRRIACPIAGESIPAPLTATFSYVVRYHRPADDEALFVRNYLDGHPPLLGRLPGIRNVMCYLPLAWAAAAGPPPADYMIGNEVVFDSAAAFDAAMAAPIRQELRAHYRTLPHFSGRNTHFAMDRTRLEQDDLSSHRHPALSF